MVVTRQVDWCGSTLTDEIDVEKSSQDKAEFRFQEPNNYVKSVSNESPIKVKAWV